MKINKYLYMILIIIINTQNLFAQNNNGNSTKNKTSNNLAVPRLNPLEINKKILAKYTIPNYRIETKYGSNGIISSIYLYDKKTDNVRDKYNGVYKRISMGFWENGKLRERFSAIGSKWEGEFVHYYENGILSEKNNYSNGLKNGEEITFYPNGKIHSKCYRKFGKLIGESISYYDNGMLEGKSLYNEQNNLQGEVNSFYDNGKNKCKKLFNDNGNLEGEVIWYYKSGEILAKFVFENGTQIGKAEYYNLNGESVNPNDINWNENNTPLISFGGNIVNLNRDK